MQDLRHFLYQSFQQRLPGKNHKCHAITWQELTVLISEKIISMHSSETHVGEGIRHWQPTQQRTTPPPVQWDPSRGKGHWRGPHTSWPSSAWEYLRSWTWSFCRTVFTLRLQYASASGGAGGGINISSNCVNTCLSINAQVCGQEKQKRKINILNQKK